MGPKQNYQDGKIALKQKDYDLALARFKQAFEQYTNQYDKANCLFQCAVVHYEIENYSLAISHFDKAKNLHPNNYNKAHCEYRKGIVHEKKLKTKLAIAAFDSALELLSQSKCWELKIDINLRCASLCSSIIRGKLIFAFFSEDQRKENKKDIESAITYYSAALVCANEWKPTDIELKGKLLFERAHVYHKLAEYKKDSQDYVDACEQASQAYVDAYDIYPFLANIAYTTLELLSDLVINFPEFYQNTLKALLSEQQLEHISKMKLPETTLKGFAKVASFLTPEADGNKLLKIYLDCARGYKKLASNTHSYTKEGKNKRQGYYQEAIRFYELALACAEVLDSNAQQKEKISACIAKCKAAMNKFQNAHDNHTLTSEVDPSLVKESLEDIPQFYRTNSNPLLPSEDKGMDRVEIPKNSDNSKPVSRASKIKILFYSSPNKEEKRPLSTDYRPLYSGASKSTG